jgi:hypothetical protein
MAAQDDHDRAALDEKLARILAAAIVRELRAEIEESVDEPVAATTPSSSENAH